MMRGASDHGAPTDHGSHPADDVGLLLVEIRLINQALLEHFMELSELFRWVFSWMYAHRGVNTAPQRYIHRHCLGNRSHFDVTRFLMGHAQATVFP